MSFRRHRFSPFGLMGLACATSAIGSLAPLAAQPIPTLPPGVCSTEVILYVDKTESTNSRETARAVVNQLNEVAASGFPGPMTLTAFAFSGEIPIATFTGVQLPLANLQTLFDSTILQEASSAVTLAPDYLALFSHIETTARTRPNLQSRRIFIVISDFSTRRGEAEHENALPVALTARLAALRQLLVSGGKQRFLAIRTRPRQEPSPSLQNDLLGELAKNFQLVEDEALLTRTLGEVLDESNTPLQVQLTFDPRTAIYSLTLANPTCQGRTNIEYYTRAAGNDTRLSLPWCPTSLRPGDAATCTFNPNQIVLPPLPNTCLNVWLRAISQVDTGAGAVSPVAGAAAAVALPRLVGTANQPVLAGSCVFLSRADLDVASALAIAPGLAACARAAGATNVANPGKRFVACLRARGRVAGDSARLRVRRTDLPGAPVILDQAIAPSSFNGSAFHGGERDIAVLFRLPRTLADWLCTPSADPAKRKLTLEVVGERGLVLATGLLGRVPTATAGERLGELWGKTLPLLLILLLLAGVAANYLQTASLGKADAVIFLLGLGLLMVAFAAYEESGLGKKVAALFGSNSSLLATVGLALLVFIYWLLYAKGFFDRKLSALGKLSLAARVPLVARRRKRFRRTVLTFLVVVLIVGGAITILWVYPRQIESCPYTLTELPTNTAVPPINLPPAPAP